MGVKQTYFLLIRVSAFIFLSFSFCRPATSVKSRAGRAKQPREPAWPVTGTAADRLSTSPGESPGVTPGIAPDFSFAAVALRPLSWGGRAQHPGLVFCKGCRILRQFGEGNCPGKAEVSPAESRAGDFPRLLESKRRRAESQPRNAPSAAEHMQEQHLDDVI